MGDELDFLRDSNEPPKRPASPAGKTPVAKPAGVRPAAKPAAGTKPVAKALPAAKAVTPAKAAPVKAAEKSVEKPAEKVVEKPAEKVSSRPAKAARGRSAPRGARPRYPLLDLASLLSRVLAGLCFVAGLGGIAAMILASFPWEAKLTPLVLLAIFVLAAPAVLLSLAELGRVLVDIEQNTRPEEPVAAPAPAPAAVADPPTVVQDQADDDTITMTLS